MNYTKKSIDILKNNWFRITSSRMEILKVLSRAKKPLSFNDIVKRALNIKLDEVTVYRFLQILEDLHLAKKINSLHGYVSCDGDTHDHNHYFLVCNECNTVNEKVIDKKDTLFMSMWICPDHQCFEIIGKCQECSK